MKNRGEAESREKESKKQFTMKISSVDVEVDSRKSEKSRRWKKELHIWGNVPAAASTKVARGWGDVEDVLTALTTPIIGAKQKVSNSAKGEAPEWIYTYVRRRRWKLHFKRFKLDLIWAKNIFFHLIVPRGWIFIILVMCMESMLDLGIFHHRKNYLSSEHPLPSCFCMLSRPGERKSYLGRTRSSVDTHTIWG